ncbi:MAG: helix-turn-helix domain-containing protein [Alphaproteobacteria bacterium]|nr:helix-turn-helix domain-containing protein [Alphaproteobacteria bacterium]
MGRAIGLCQDRFGRATMIRLDHPVVTHAHPQFNIVFKHGGADTQFRIGEAVHPLTADNLLLIDPWQPHANLHDAAAPTRLVSILVEHGWARDAGLCGCAHRGPAACGFHRPSAPFTPALRRAADALARRIAGGAAGGEDPAALIGGILAALTATPGPAPSGQAARGHSDDYRIRRVIEFIRRHPSKRHHADALAAHAGLSRSRFFDRFRDCMGVSPQCFVDAVCVDAAMQVLRGSGAPLAELADRLGFSAQSHFSRFFTQRTGISPSEYRRRAGTA